MLYRFYTYYMQGKWPTRLSWLLIAVFVASSLQRFVVHPSGGHTHRQADTIGMSMMFAEDIKARGLGALDFVMYPKVLQRGLQDGINASEFPLLNVITGPFFLLRSPVTGVFLASLLVLLLNLWTACTYLPRHLRFWNVQIDSTTALLIWLCAGTVASQSNVMMPEGVALPLVLIGMTLILESGSNWKRLLLGIVICNLGIATKPTVAVAVAALPALAVLVREQHHRAIKLLLATGACLLFPAYWYLPHAKHVLSIAQGPQIFALAHFDPIDSFRQVGWRGLIGLLRREPYQGQFPMFVGWVWITAALYLGEWAPVLLYFTALIAAISLDGAHIFVHTYYFIGTSLFAIVIMARALARATERRRVHALLLTLTFWGVLFNIRGNVWVWARDSDYWRIDHWKTGSIARDMIPASYHLVTDDGAYPLKMLYIGRSGTAANGSALDVCNHDPYRSIPLAIVTSRSPLPGQICAGRKIELKVAETPFERWSVILVDGG
jgi:hypothetical protein